MLFLWAKAEKLSLKYGLRMIAPDWVQISRVGPWLRKERYKRYYLGDFTNLGYVRGIEKQILLRMLPRIDGDELESSVVYPSRRVIVVSKDEGFRPVINDHDYIREKLLSIVSEGIRSAVSHDRGAYIGVHVRRGDFKGISQDLPTEWYISVCRYLRKEYSESLPVRVFSDATNKELEEFSQLRDCKIMPKAPAILDLFLLSQSRYVVGTSMSTFSLWASYLLRRPTFWSPVSPGVHGYGLSTDNHFYTGWDGCPK